MTMPFIGQIEIFAFGKVPRAGRRATGRLLPINQNQALFSLLGTHMAATACEFRAPRSARPRADRRQPARRLCDRASAAAKRRTRSPPRNCRRMVTP